MRKIKKIGGYLVIRFNAREMKEWGSTLGEYGVIDAELYTGCLDVDKGALEFDGIDNLEEAIEQAKGLLDLSEKIETEHEIRNQKERDEAHFAGVEQMRNYEQKLYIAKTEEELAEQFEQAKGFLSGMNTCKVFSVDDVNYWTDVCQQIMKCCLAEIQKKSPSYKATPCESPHFRRGRSGYTAEAFTGLWSG